MSTSMLDSAAADVFVDDRSLRIVLRDGREISAPIEWFPALQSATPAVRRNWRLIGEGEGIRWSDLDEDISVAALMRLG